MSNTGLMVVKAKTQSMTFLGNFLKFLASWEIPIKAMKTEAGGMITSRNHQPTEGEWARFKQVMFPKAKTTYVLQVNVGQALAVEDFAYPLAPNFEIVSRAQIFDVDVATKGE